MEEKSTAYTLIEFVWNNELTKSYSRLNANMQDAMNLAINSNMNFHEDDFEKIRKKFRGGYWFGCNSNGKGHGERFYLLAISVSNKTAIKSYEKYEEFKPYISSEGHRMSSSSTLKDAEYRYLVTGFDFETKRIYLVRYLISDWEGKGKKKLLNFDNKEWLVFRKTVKEF